MTRARSPDVQAVAARLVDKDDERRLSDRFALTVNTRCRTGDGPLPEVWLLDISRKGCQLFGRQGAFRPGQDVILLNLAGAARSGRVAWTAQMKAGVEFDQVICAEVFAGMLDNPAIAEFDRSETEPMKDQFGRKLAPLPPLGRAFRDRR
ncbi:MAG: PilZ domain-containing protein [Oxalobacteraceae bacterium]|nr:MAG: PilZ domain-containing protein [Oxalobacteraceae bacterium]